MISNFCYSIETCHTQNGLRNEYSCNKFILQINTISGVPNDLTFYHFMVKWPDIYHSPRNLHWPKFSIAININMSTNFTVNHVMISCSMFCMCHQNYLHIHSIKRPQPTRVTIVASSLTDWNRFLVIWKNRYKTYKVSQNWNFNKLCIATENYRRN